MDDTISRQDAIDEIEHELEMINSALDSITLDFNARERLRQRRGEAREILNSIQQLPSAQPEPCDDPRADVYYLAEKIGIHRLYALVVELRGEPEPCEDAVSRQAAIDIFDDYSVSVENGDLEAYSRDRKRLCELPSAQSKNTDCIYCHEDSDGYVKPIEKNCHAFIRFGMNGWEISLGAKGWNGSAKIMYCPMCGRRLGDG